MQGLVLIRDRQKYSALPNLDSSKIEKLDIIISDNAIFLKTILKNSIIRNKNAIFS
jgi:hypothetical protein